jgi:hypothetical protein
VPAPASTSTQQSIKQHAKIAIGDRRFATKKAATDEIRRILYAWPDREPITGADAELLTALIAMHPRAAEKIDNGIRACPVQPAGRGTRCFHIVRVDGTSIDFSYKTALSGDASHPALVRRAMRASIDRQIAEYRRKAFADCPTHVCPISGNELRNNPDTHVDHTIPFIDIADTFAVAMNGYNNIDVHHSVQPGMPGPQLTSPTREEFQAFHKATAKLRLLHAAANLARPRNAE